METTKHDQLIFKLEAVFVAMKNFWLITTNDCQGHMTDSISSKFNEKTIDEADGASSTHLT